MNLQKIDLDSVLVEVFQQVQVLAGEKIKLQISDIEPVEVMADRDRMKQVYLNLLANAVKYTPAGGSVIVSLKTVDNRVQTMITDTGPGIPARDLPHIFERFYRGDKARTRSADGSSFGLGLSIAFWIVKNHSGVIEVQSKEGSGTSFTVWLPVFHEQVPNK